MNTPMTQRWNRRSIAMAGLVLSLGVLLVCHYLRTSTTTASESTLRDSSTTQASLQPSSNIPEMIPADFQPEDRQSPTEIELLPIEQIKVGMRVPALNPEVTAEERATFKDPDPATWQLMELEHEKPDGGLLLISMLRPIEWIHQQGIHSGGSFQIEMPELGAKGLAKVLALKPCPEIQAGPGHVVLSTFAHPATHEILDVTIGEGEDVETIGVTETHPFWSVQDQTFVPVGHLVAGSQVLTADEQTKTITSILPRPGPAQQVYNLEVNGEHVYYVGHQQLLVHNDCPLVIMGENMDRVNAYADLVKGETISDWLAAKGLTWTKELNQQWVEEMMANGRTIVDIGPDFQARLGSKLSGFQPPKKQTIYGMEREMLQGYDRYVSRWERLGRYSGRILWN